MSDSYDYSDADLANMYGDSYVSNQSAYDVVDNGAVTKTGDTATTSSPGWASSLTSLVQGVSTLSSAVAPVLGAVGAGPTKTSGTAAGLPTASNAPAPKTSLVTGGLSTTTVLIIVGVLVAGIFAGFMFLRKK